MQRILLTLAIGVAVLGCSGEDKGNRLPTAPVEVTVTYKGKPVDGAMVTLIPIGNVVVPANGLTNSSGKAKMFTYESGDGALLGTHKVQIVKQDLQPPTNSASIDSPDYDPDATPPPPPKPLIPRKYFTTVTSGLSAEIEKKSKNEITFELKD
jgi:hypothetical protein